MDWAALRSRGRELTKKYRYVLLVVLAGLVLMALPEGKKPEPETAAPQAEAVPDLQTELEEILGKVQGAGKVRVLLTQQEGEQTVYQTDEDSDGTDVRLDTVILNGSDRAQTGLVRQVNPPTYLGAVVVCQGADSAAVRLAIAQAVSSVTGLTTNKITVLKMK